MARVCAGWGFSQAFYRAELEIKAMGYSSLEDFLSVSGPQPRQHRAYEVHPRINPNSPARWSGNAQRKLDPVRNASSVGWFNFVLCGGIS
jgi:hypothetical protein